MLIGDEVLQEVAIGALPVEVVGDILAEEACVLVPEAARRDQQGDGQGHGERDREGKAETLDDDLARELANDIGQVRGRDLDQEHVDGGGAVRPDLDDFL